LSVGKAENVLNFALDGIAPNELQKRENNSGYGMNELAKILGAQIRHQNIEKEKKKFRYPYIWPLNACENVTLGA
jgi:hypothetical protein